MKGCICADNNMVTKLGINGFGRIGRLVVRAAIEGKQGVQVVAVNDPFLSIEYAAYLFKHDSVHLILPGEVTIEDDFIVYDGKIRIKFLSERNPADIPWGENGADYVCESTGIFTTIKGIRTSQRGSKESDRFCAICRRTHVCCGSKSHEL